MIISIDTYVVEHGAVIAQNTMAANNGDFVQLVLNDHNIHKVSGLESAYNNYNNNNNNVDIIMGFYYPV